MEKGSTISVRSDHYIFSGMGDQRNPQYSGYCHGHRWLPAGCNQVVHALLASKYHSMDKSLCEETEKLKGDCISIYENVFTTYEKNYYVDCIVLSGRDVIGYASDKNTDSSRLEAHIKDILKKNSYKQNVKIFTEKRAFMDRVESLGTREPEEVPFREDDPVIQA